MILPEHKIHTHWSCTDSLQSDSFLFLHVSSFFKSPNPSDIIYDRHQRDQILMLMRLKEKNHFLEAIGISSCILFVYLTKAFHINDAVKSQREWVYIRCQSLKLFPDTRRVLKTNYICLFSALAGEIWISFSAFRAETSCI